MPVLVALLLSCVGYIAFMQLPPAAGGSSRCSTSQYVRAPVSSALTAATKSIQSATSSVAGSLRGKHSSTAAAADKGHGNEAAAPILKGFVAGLLMPQEVTPGFLDGALAAGSSSSDLRQLMQMQQDAFCR